MTLITTVQQYFLLLLVFNERMFCRYVLDLQSVKKYIRETILFMPNSPIQENFNLVSIFQQLSACIKNILSLKGRLGTRLKFYEVLRFS